jgi:hypothetical protein
MDHAHLELHHPLSNDDLPGDYKVKLQAGWQGCPEAVLGISLQSSTQLMVHGPKLHDFIRRIRQRVHPPAILLGDSLHRYDFTELPPEQAYQRSLSIGDDWLDENAAILHEIPVTRWDEVRNLPSFSDHYDTIEKMERSDPRFHKLLEADTERFLRKRTRTREAEIASRAFLKEELAGVLAWFSGRHVAFFYNGSFLASKCYLIENSDLRLANCTIRRRRLRRNRAA